MEEDEGYDDAALQEIEQFLVDDDDEEDEDTKLERLATERKKKREMILQQVQKQIPTQNIPRTPAVESVAAVEEVERVYAERAAVEEEELKSKKSTVLDMFSAVPHDDALAFLGLGDPTLASVGGDDPFLQSNWDDGEGYYKARTGEVICGHYLTVGVVGKGVFATVLKCLDARKADSSALGSCVGDGSDVDKTNTDASAVAIKLIRNNDIMRKAAEKEKSILQAIAARDPENKRYCIRLLDVMEYRHHIAFVFEFQAMNLREALKKFGNNVGINIGAVRMYARQLFVALRLLADLRIVHADIKLDNILCSRDLKQVKLCDFGSAFRETDPDNNPTPYLVSRFYRAPEIILGLQYDRAIDTWSVAVCLYELFTGLVMFPGRSNNEMLRLIMAVKGKIPNRIIKQHQRQYDLLHLEAHFDNDSRFKQAEVDTITGKPVIRLIEITAPSKDIAQLLRSSKAGSDDGKLVAQLGDFLEKCLTIDPAKRLPVGDALGHQFFKA